EQVVEHVGALADQRGSVAAHPFDNRLDRLLAEFLGDLCLAASEQLCRVGGRRVGAAARIDDPPHPVKRVAELVSHTQPPFSRSPRAAVTGGICHCLYAIYAFTGTAIAKSKRPRGQTCARHPRLLKPPKIVESKARTPGSGPGKGILGPFRG